MTNFSLVSQLVSSLKHCLYWQLFVILSAGQLVHQLLQQHQEDNQGFKDELLRTTGQKQGVAKCQGLLKNHQLGTF